MLSPSLNDVRHRRGMSRSRHLTREEGVPIHIGGINYEAMKEIGISLINEEVSCSLAETALVEFDKADY